MKKILSLLLLFLATSAVAQEKISFFFDNNKFELNKVEYTKLTKWIAENKSSKILSITGSTDEVGSSGYNDTLSQNRVNYIFNQIKDKVQIRTDFKTISLGEKGATSSNKAENRKAIIHFLQEKDLALENAIIGIKEVEEIIVIPDSLPLVEKIKLARIGTKIVLKNINFYQNTFATVQESQPALWDLFQVMLDNPNLKIQIQGHICCIDKDHRNLSTDRAKQIKRFLVYQGIAQHRIQTKGFGVSQPLYPIPEATEEQAAANRRVEIEILNK